MSRILAVAGALPEHRHDQREITEALAGMIGATGTTAELLRRVHANSGVSQRFLALPLHEYAALPDFTAANDRYLEVAVDLGARAILDALAAAALTPHDVDLVISTTITGIAVPSIEARIAGRIGLREDVVRMPLFGLGCVAGAAGIARAHDYLRGQPGKVAVVLAVELCSLTVQRDDTSRANLVASGLFGDGAAAVVLAGAEHSASSATAASSASPASPATAASPTSPAGQVGAAEATGPTGIATLTPSAAPTAYLSSHATRTQPEVLDTRSRLYPDTERAMGWDVGSTGLRIVLDVAIPTLVRTHVRGDVDRFLAGHGLTRDDIGWWVAHPGGPKVLEAMADALEVPREALGVTWRSLDRIGNLSSASVLHVLADTLADHPPTPGSHGMLLAMGPGFCLELVLLRAPGAPEPPALSLVAG